MSDECKKRAPESYIRPTPQERQSAAEEMRRDPGFPEEVTFRSEDGEFFQRNAFYMGNRVVSLFPKAETWRDVQLALADLIDPTCHAEVVTEDTSDGLTARRVKCSACHTVWLEPSRVRYCPNCGARRIFDASGVANATDGDI